MGKMNLTEDRFLNRKNLVALAMVVVFLHASLSVIHWLIDTTWIDIINFILIGVLGFGVILYTARQEVPFRFQPAQCLLILFMFLFIISCISMTITYNNDWLDFNTTEMRSAAVSLFLIFPAGYVLIREEKRNVALILMHTVLIAWSLFILVVLIHVFQGKTMTAPVTGGKIGMVQGNLCINGHYNIAGSWEMLFFMACCFAALRSEKIWVKAAYGVLTAVHYIALTLTNSRASFLAVLAAFAAMTGIAVYLRLKSGKEIRKILIAAAAGLAAAAVYYFLRPYVFKLLPTAGGPGSGGAQGRTLFAKDFSTFNDRTKLWKWSIQGLTSSARAFIFGFTPKSVPTMIAQMSNGQYPNSYSHNQFVEVAASIGVPGLIVFLAWFIIILIDTWKLFFIRKERSSLLYIPVIALAMMLANMMEAHLLYYDHIVGYAFFLLCGILHGYVNGPARPFRIPEKLRLGKARKNARMSGQA